MWRAVRALGSNVERRRSSAGKAPWTVIQRCESAAAPSAGRKIKVSNQPYAAPPKPDEKLDVLYAVPREETGSRASMKMRRVGRIPGIVFSQEDGQLGGHKQLVTFDVKRLNLLLRRFGHSFFMSRLYTLEIRTDLDPKQGELISTERVLPKLLHVHAVSDKVLNLTLIRAPPHARLRVDIPLVYVGQDTCPGIRRGGYLNTIRRTVQYYGAPDVIPRYIEVDLSTLETAQTVCIRDLNVPDGLVVYAMDPRWPVCKIMGSRASRAPPGATT